MSLFNIFKKKQMSDESKEQTEQIRKTNGVSKQTQVNISSFINMETTCSVEDDIVPAERRIKNAVASNHGLFPHKVLILDYAESFYTDTNKFQSFWWYRYGVNDVNKCLHSLLDRCFLKVGDLQCAIEKENLTVLKEELKIHGLKVNGKKEEIVKRLVSEVSKEELDSRFTRRTYQLSELGKQALEEEDYVPYIHRHLLEDLDIWSLNILVHNPPIMPYRDKIWGYLNKCSMDHFAALDFGLYRNCRHHMSTFLMEEKKTKDALCMLSEVIFYDLSGLSNGFDQQFINIFAQNFFPYNNSTVTIAPGIIELIEQCKNELNLTDEEMKAIMLERINKLSVPFHLFTPVECVDIVYMEAHGEMDALTNLYEKARRRFNER